MAPSRGLLMLRQTAIVKKSYWRCQCRTLHASKPCQSGHNRWSKIKHDKGKNDAAKNRQRSIFAQEIATASKLFGPEPNNNPRLADLITKAKREGFAKASIESAIARGQGRSPSGAHLENVTVEGILPNNVAVIVECETDSKLRTLADVRLIIRDNGGSAAPASYLFEKRGRILFDRKDGLSSAEALDAALDAGAIDVDDTADGRIEVLAEPDQTKAVGDALSKALELQIATSGIIWDPNKETMIGLLNEEAVRELSAFVDDLHEREPSIQAISMNVMQGSASESGWRELQNRIGSL